MRTAARVQERQVPLLEVRDLSKAFGAQLALDRVSLTLAAGEIHGLIGQNGCGKSTLLKILTGFHQPGSNGSAFVRGVPMQFGDLARGVPIRAVHQDLGLIPELSAMDNLATGTGYATRAGTISWRAQRRRTQRYLEQVGIGYLDPRRPLTDATQVERTMVAIARAVSEWDETEGVLVLDEPSSNLPAPEVAQLGELVRGLARSGIGIIFVSHSLREVMDLADHVTVLREGRVVTSQRMSGLDEHALLELMLGQERLSELERLEDHASSPTDLRTQTQPVVTVSGLRSATVREFGFEALPGEIVGVTGLGGSGHLDVAYVLGGARRASAGAISVAGLQFDARRVSPSRLTAAGLTFVPARRAMEGVIGRLTVSDNLGLPQIRRFRRGRVISSRRVREHARHWTRLVGIRPADPDARAETLSGGNQQKIVLGKWMDLATACLVLAEPTVGVDLGAKLQIYNLVRGFAAQGIAVVVASTDITDLLALCDRVLVMSNGVVCDELSGERLTERVALAAIAGAPAAKAVAVSSSGS